MKFKEEYEYALTKRNEAFLAHGRSNNSDDFWYWQGRLRGFGGYELWQIRDDVMNNCPGMGFMDVALMGYHDACGEQSLMTPNGV